MITVAICFAVLVFFAALVVFFINFNAEKYGSNGSRALGAGFAAALILIIGLGVGSAGTAITSKASISNQLKFTEHWNGFETAAKYSKTECEKSKTSSNCANTFSCDSYPKEVQKSRTVKNSKGENTTQYYTEIETRWHDCPYSTQETSYWVETTLKQKISYGSNLMTGTQWRSGHEMRGGRKTDPESWLQANHRIKMGEPEGVSKTNVYDNYLLASNDNLYRRNDQMVETLKTTNLLPALSLDIDRMETSPKFYAVGGLNLSHNYTKDVAKLNGAIGVDNKQGDLRVVMIDSNVSGEPGDYVNALAAYWSDTKVFGKNSLPKNSVVVVLGVNSTNNTVAWSRAFTAMPTGNEGFETAIMNDMKGQKVDANLLGRPGFDQTKTVKHSSGKLENILWSDTNGFKRESMSGDGLEGGGFLYLGSSIQPTKGAVIGAGFIWFFALAGGVVAGLAGRNAYTDLARNITKS